MNFEERNNRRREFRRRKRAKKLRAKRIRFAFFSVAVIALGVFGFNKLWKRDGEPLAINNQKIIEQQRTGPEEGDEVLADTPTTTPGAETQTSKGFSLKLQSFLKATADAPVFRDPNDKSKNLFNIKIGDYVESYGQEGSWVKIRSNAKTGYMKAENLIVIDDPTMFKVIDGVLLVNKDYSLPEDYDPGVNTEAEEAVKLMIESAKRDAGLTLKIASGYRNFSYQATIQKNYIKQYGEEYTESMSAKAGQSEHQTGLAFDLMGEDTTARVNSKFDNTPEAKWLESNAYKFGFILRYPEGKKDVTGYIYESWHYRYLGVELATAITNRGISLEEYLQQ